ncbi:hypothetical protein F5B22DRAFT_165761 [Xylaria bambusicola]|uniref:uncharacterized protein n=1 Tax=Xylaria bambusicola TaxID=326684 RepID=UPI0020087C34|nr:uncharacterized protein F5B22DRAFT_165761 [Xylaria bambusicola]KAI0526561.1 hypothetical protein F5B22DRAFT_165761 [Xylaria bambusicola]
MLLRTRLTSRLFWPVCSSFMNPPSFAHRSRILHNECLILDISISCSPLSHYRRLVLNTPLIRPTSPNIQQPYMKWQAKPLR